MNRKERGALSRIVISLALASVLGLVAYVILMGLPAAGTHWFPEGWRRKAAYRFHRPPPGSAAVLVGVRQQVDDGGSWPVPGPGWIPVIPMYVLTFSIHRGTSMTIALCGRYTGAGHPIRGLPAGSAGALLSAAEQVYCSSPGATLSG